MLAASAKTFAHLVPVAPRSCVLSVAGLRFLAVDVAPIRLPVTLPVTLPVSSALTVAIVAESE